MSWFYSKFKKSDDDSKVSLTSTYIELTGVATNTGNFTVTGNETVTGTARVVSYLYLGTGTKALVTGTAGIDPINTGITGSFDKGSIFMGGTANLYYKTDYASTSWASIDAYD